MSPGTLFGQRSGFFIRVVLYFFVSRAFLQRVRGGDLFGPQSRTRKKGGALFQNDYKILKGVNIHGSCKPKEDMCPASGLGPSPTTQGRTWCAFSTTSPPRPPSTSAASGASAAAHPYRLQLHCVFLYLYLYFLVEVQPRRSLSLTTIISARVITRYGGGSAFFRVARRDAARRSSPRTRCWPSVR